MQWSISGGGRGTGTNINLKETPQSLSGSKDFCGQTILTRFSQFLRFTKDPQCLVHKPTPQSVQETHMKAVVHNHVFLSWLNKAVFIIIANLAVVQNLSKMFVVYLCVCVYVCLPVFVSTYPRSAFKRKL